MGVAKLHVGWPTLSVDFKKIILISKLGLLGSGIPDTVAVLLLEGLWLGERASKLLQVALNGARVIAPILPQCSIVE